METQNELYQLVTDQGFLNESNVIWETLNNIEGDGEFVDHEFALVPPKKISSTSMEYMSAEEVKNQEDQDYLLALSLQEEYKKELEQVKEWERDKVESGMVELSDEELARRLQQEEEEKQQQSFVSHTFHKPATASHHAHLRQQQQLQQQMRNLKIHDGRGQESGSAGSSNGSTCCQQHLNCRQEDHYGSRQGTGQQHVRPEQKEVAVTEGGRNQLDRPSSGQSLSRRRTTSDSFAIDSYNRRSPAGRGSHSDGGGGAGSGGSDGSDGHRDHRRNKSSVSATSFDGESQTNLSRSPLDQEVPSHVRFSDIHEGRMMRRNK